MQHVTQRLARDSLFQLDTHPKKEDPKERKLLRKKNRQSLSHANTFRSGRRKLSLLS